MAGVSSVGALSDPLSMIVRTMHVEAGTISLGAETRLATGFVSVEVVTGTSGTVTMVASEMTTAGTDSQYLVQVQLLKFEVCCPLRQCLP